MSLLLGVDAGNYHGKVVGEHGAIMFRTSICEWFERDIKETFGVDDMEFEIGGRRGYSGTIASYEDEYGIGTMYGNTKAHEDTKIRILLAIYQYIEAYCAGQEDVTIVTGQPITTHKDEDKRRIVDMVKGEHEFSVNGRRHRLNIKDVGVGAEGSSAYWGKVNDGLVRIIDVGSSTVNCATVHDAKHIHSSSGTFNFGTETINRKEDIAGLARGIVRATSELKWDRGDKVYVCGGVAEEIIPYIRNQYIKAELLIPECPQKGGEIKELEPVFANAVGYYELARLVYG